MRKYIAIVVFTLLVTEASNAQQDSTAATDSLLSKKLSQQMQPQVQQTQSTAQPRNSINTNPNISVIGDFQMHYYSNLDKNFEFNFNEAEFTFQSVVDPYARADFFLSLEKDPSSGNYEASIEEAYLTTLELPADLQLKTGKFRSALGRVNPLHPHALPFIDLPNAFVNFFGEDGMKREGLSLSWLVPNPLDFYQELTFEVTDVPLNNPSFVRSNVDKYFFLTHLKNFWDLTPNATLELGVTGMTGPNDSSFSTNVGALDLTYKWKPLQFNTYKSFVWQTEFFYNTAKVAENSKVNSFGMYSFATYQLEKRWFLTGRYDYSNLPFESSLVERAYSATLGWYATEFQKIELQGKLSSSNYQDQFSQAMLRWVFVIGSHGAHQY